MKSKLTREIQFSPAFDKRDPSPNKNCGVHGVEMRWLLKGPKGVVQFVVYTNWMLPAVAKEMRQSMSPDNYCLYEPMAADLGYHSPKPLYDNQKGNDGCSFLSGKRCYYDGSGLNAEPVLELLITKGDGAVWKRLEQEYQDIFQ